jgi:hypothetical protein
LRLNAQIAAWKHLFQPLLHNHNHNQKTVGLLQSNFKLVLASD